MEIYYDIFIGDVCVAQEMPFAVADILIKGLLQAYPEDYTMAITIKMTERCAAVFKPAEEAVQGELVSNGDAET